MKDLWKKYTQIGLVKRIVTGLIIGTIFAIIRPNLGTSTAGNVLDVLKLFGSMFTGALKSIAPILVFFLVMESLCKHKEGQKTNMKHVIVLYLVATFLAALFSVIASFLFPIKMTLPPIAEEINPPKGLDEVLTTLLLNIVDNPVRALSTPNYMGILFWAVLIGLALKKASESTKTMISNFADATSSVVHIVIKIFEEYAMLIALLLGTMFFVALIVNPIMVWTQLKINPYPLVLACIKKSGLTAFFTRSSAANIPVNMELCKQLELDEDTYSVSIPLGATINMGGAAITISIMTLAAANTLGVEVDFATAFVLSVLSALGACGASGVAGGSLLLIPLACSLFGIPAEASAQVVGVGYIIGVIQDSAETAINSSTDVLFTAVADFAKKAKDGEKIDYKRLLSNVK